MKPDTRYKVKLSIQDLATLHMAVCRLQDEVPVDSPQGKHYFDLGDRLYKELEWHAL